MAENKTKQTDADVTRFVEGIEDEKKIPGSYTLIGMMQKATGEPPKMWGPTIIGFGSYHYKYESGHEGDACLIGFSPRKAKYSLYMMGDFEGFDALLEKLGKYKKTKGCIYVNKLEDIDLKVLEEIIKRSVAHMRKKYPKGSKQ